jgi:hypothetical protein
MTNGELESASRALATLVTAGIITPDEAYRLLVKAGAIEDVRAGDAVPMELLLTAWKSGYANGNAYPSGQTYCVGVPETEVKAVLLWWKEAIR